MYAKQLFFCAVIIAIIHSVGCQTWQGASFPLQNATRVPPPGTGTYQLPTGYYNNSTSALTPAGQTMQASNGAASGLRTASGPLPTTNLNSAFQPANALGSGVVPAAFQSEATNRPAGSASNFSDSSTFSDSSGGSSSGAAASLSDAPNTEAPSLQWQQFSGQ